MLIKKKYQTLLNKVVLDIGENEEYYLKCLREDCTLYDAKALVWRGLCSGERVICIDRKCKEKEIIAIIIHELAHFKEVDYLLVPKVDEWINMDDFSLMWYAYGLVTEKNKRKMHGLYFLQVEKELKKMVEGKRL